MTNQDANTGRLLKIDLADGKRTLIVEDPQYDLSASSSILRPHALEAVGVERERPEWIVLDPQLKGDYDFLTRCFKGLLVCQAATCPIKPGLWLLNQISAPFIFIYTTVGPKSSAFCSALSRLLENYQLSPMQPITYKARDGMDLHGYLTLPYGT